MARARRRPGEPTGPLVPGWDKKATERPTACRRATTVAGVIVVQHGHNRPRARPRSVGPPPSLRALDIPLVCFTDGQRSAGEGGGQRHAAPSGTSVSCAGGPPTPGGRTAGSRAATRNACAACSETRARGVLASGPWQSGAGWAWGARLGGQPQPGGSPQKSSTGPHRVQEVVVNRNVFSKQVVRVSALVRVALVLPSLQEGLPKWLPNCEKGCGM